MSTTFQKEGRIWRAAGGDATRRGLFPEKVQLEPDPPRKLLASGAVQAAAVFDESGRAFVADMTGVVQAFSAAGELLWRVELPGGISATPAVHPTKPRLFVGTHTGFVCALHTEKGARTWSTQLPTKADPRILSDFLCLPESDVVVLNSWGGRFQALDAGSGKERFGWEAGISPYSAASAASDESIYSMRVTDKRGVEFVRVTSDGAETVLNQTPAGKRGPRRTMVAAAPVLDEERGVVYFIVNRDHGSVLRAWSLRTSAVLWSLALPNAVRATPAVRSDGVILAPDLAGFVQAAGSEGALRFRCASGSDYLLAGAASEAGGTSFLGDPIGVVHSIDERGSAREIFEAPRAIQARLSFDPEGNMYVPSTDHRVYVFARSSRA